MLRKHTVFLILFLTISFSNVFAQKIQKKTFSDELNSTEYVPIYLGYYGNNITNPGVKVGFEWDLLIIEKTIEKAKKVKIRRTKLILSPSVAYYYNAASHGGLVISADAIWRTYTKRLFIFDAGIGVAYYTIFNSGESWEVDDNGNANNNGTGTRGYFSPAISFSFGKQFSLKNGLPMDIYSRVNINGLADYNAGSVAEYSLELGVRMSFHWGIKKSNTKTVKKSKKR